MRHCFIAELVQLLEWLSSDQDQHCHEAGPTFSVAPSVFASSILGCSVCIRVTVGICVDQITRFHEIADEV